MTGLAFATQAHLMAITVQLHERGLVPIAAVIEEIQEIGVTHATEGDPVDVSPGLVDLLQSLTELAAALPAFSPAIPPHD